ncbi:nuclease [Gemmobacter lanyuensis]
MVLALPLDQIEADYLVRDRLTADPEDMAALVESLRARGQRPHRGRGPGPRPLRPDLRLAAAARLRQLAAEDAKFTTVLALLRPDQSSDAYVAMVEENEIRVGLSFYERARIALKAVEAGVFPDDRSALSLFASASRAKRSKIGSFLTLVRALDGALRFPEAIGERLGLQLAQALEADRPCLRLQLALQAEIPDAMAEQTLLQRALTPPAPNRSPRNPAPGFRLRMPKSGQILIEGQGSTPPSRPDWRPGSAIKADARVSRAKHSPPASIFCLQISSGRGGEQPPSPSIPPRRGPFRPASAAKRARSAPRASFRCQGASRVSATGRLACNCAGYVWEKHMGQTVLVTGGAGYIGAHACKVLKAAGSRRSPSTISTPAGKRR